MISVKYSKGNVITVSTRIWVYKWVEHWSKINYHSFQPCQNIILSDGYSMVFHDVREEIFKIHQHSIEDRQCLPKSMFSMGNALVFQTPSSANWRAIGDLVQKWLFKVLHYKLYFWRRVFYRRNDVLTTEIVIGFH